MRAWIGLVVAGAVLLGHPAPTVAQPGPASDGDGSAVAGPLPEGALRVATINMWGIAYVSTYIEERFAALAERLAASDLHVVGLQEVWATGPRLALRQALADQFPYQVDFQTEQGESGLLILSRFPIGERHYTSFAVNGKPWKVWHGDWWGGKGIGVVRVDTPSGPFWFGDTHLHARYQARPPGGDEMDDQYAYDRWHQAHTVRYAVARFAGDFPAIVVGDFNFTRASLYYRLLRGEFDDRRPDAPAVAVWEDAASAMETRRIDLIWTREGRTAGWRVLSPPTHIFTEPVPVLGGPPQPLTDHRGLAATLVPVPRTGPNRPLTLPPAPTEPWELVPHVFAAWPLLVETGEAREVAWLLGGGVALVALGAMVFPWRGRAARVRWRFVRGLGGPMLIGVGITVVWIVLSVLPMRAAGYAFWRQTAPQAVPTQPPPAPNAVE